MFKERRLTRDWVDNIMYGGDKNSIWVLNPKEQKLCLYDEFDINTPHKVFFMRNHSGAGRIWDALNLCGELHNGASVLHIDAHDDLKIEWPLITDLEEMRNRTYQVGSFIAPRISTGLIRQLHWVKPHAGTKPADSSDIQYLIHKFNFQTTESTIIPSQSSFDLIDIDLDYFTSLVSDSWPQQYLVYLVRKKLTEITNKYTASNIKAVTIASSPGFIRWKDEKILIETALKHFVKWYSKI